MTVLEAIHRRRSIRNYQDRQIPEEALRQILKAGACAPNAGGGQRTILCGVRSRALAGRLGRWNLARFDRSRLAGGFVSRHRRPLHPQRLLRRACGVRSVRPGGFPLQHTGRLLLRGEHGAGGL